MYSLSQVVCQNGDVVCNCGITWRRVNEYSTWHPPFIKKPLNTALSLRWSILVMGICEKAYKENGL